MFRAHSDDRALTVKSYLLIPKSDVLIPLTFILALIFALALPLSAQPSVNGSGHRSLATRSELEQAAVAAEQIARNSREDQLRKRKREEAMAIRERLREGDFQPGHRIFITVIGDSALSDTFTVRSDRKLLLPDLPPLPLVGVLDSELQAYLAKEIAKYLRNPTVTATGLLRVSISGAVGSPGFYQLPTDMMISDAIMSAGGPTATANLRAVTVRRGGTTAIGKTGMDEAIRLGLTLSDVGLRPGDELAVPDKASNTWGRVWTAATAISGFALTIFWLTSR